MRHSVDHCNVWNIKDQWIQPAACISKKEGSVDDVHGTSAGTERRARLGREHTLNNEKHIVQSIA
jgi:hypothetical protein